MYFILLSFGVFEPFLSSVVRHMFGQYLLRTKLRNCRGRIIFMDVLKCRLSNNGQRKSCHHLHKNSHLSTPVTEP